MKIIQLEYFIAVVKHQSFTKAAHELHISQPSLTAAIKKLEHTIGYDLLHRSTKDIKITDKGIQFYHYAQQLVHQYHQTLDKMHDLNTSDTPKMHIGILESTTQWISTLVRAHQMEYPNQHYRISEIHDQDITQQYLLDFDIQIGITNDEIKHEDIISIPIYEEAYVLLVPASESDTRRARSLKNLPLILPTKAYQVRKHLDDYFMRMQIRPNIVVEVDCFASAAQFVHQGLGYAVIPQVFYQSTLNAKLSTVHIKPNVKRTIYINYLKKRKHDHHVLSFIDTCIQFWQFNE